MTAERKRARIFKMTVLESYLELGELLTIRYDPNGLSGQLGRPYETFRACIWACPLFVVKKPGFHIY